MNLSLKILIVLKPFWLTNEETFWDSVLDKIWLEEITPFTVYFFDAKVKNILSKVKPIPELKKLLNDWLNLRQIVHFKSLIKWSKYKILSNQSWCPFKNLNQNQFKQETKSLDFEKLNWPFSFKYPDVLKNKLNSQGTEASRN